MDNQLSDIPPAISKMIVEGYGRMSPREKLKRVDEMTKTVQQLAIARIRKQHEDISGREQQLRLASLWIDRETMIRVFDWDPGKHGY
ncbi:MAG: hypothetical protein JW882_03245 [Deltaproteobacteria bacterium]|nr:hypothetical protein [Deltaproteobacteria bacterium]